MNLLKLYLDWKVIKKNRINRVLIKLIIKVIIVVSW